MKSEDDRWYNSVYLCKLCGKKVVNVISWKSVSFEDISMGLDHLKEFEEVKSEIHNNIDKSKCFGLCEFMGFEERKDGSNEGD